MALEGTDYDRLEYNFCQSRNPETGKTYLQGDAKCYSNDPASYITWGPRGATAGHGAEVQQVLYLIDRSRPQLIDDAFGSDANIVRRLITADASSRVLILCSVWISSQRRESLGRGFAKFGSYADVQSTYRKIYDSVDADGWKIRSFFRLYDAIGRPVTNADFAFFLDRATHGGVPSAQDRITLAPALAAFIIHGSVSPAQLRWQVAQRVTVSNQQGDRRGRDVVFVIDDPNVPITATDRELWVRRADFKSSDFGLDDQSSASRFEPTAGTGYGQVTKVANATETERRSCPVAALAPLKPPRSR
jgi:hypothetical protein